MSNRKEETRGAPVVCTQDASLLFQLLDAAMPNCSTQTIFDRLKQTNAGKQLSYSLVYRARKRGHLLCPNDYAKLEQAVEQLVNRKLSDKSIRLLLKKMCDLHNKDAKHKITPAMLQREIVVMANGWSASNEK